LLEKAMKLMPTVIQAAQVRAIHNPHHSICLLIIVSPIGSKGFLTSNIPYIEAKAGHTKFKQSSTSGFSSWKFEYKWSSKTRTEASSFRHYTITD
jgi:hypothetical protein